MKRLITIILVLALLLPAAALAGDSPYYGRWIAQKHGSTGTCSAILYYLSIIKPSISAYFEFWIHEGGLMSRPSIEKEEMYTDEFEIVDKHIKVPTDGISYIEVFYDEETDTLYTKEWPELTFVRIP